MKLRGWVVALLLPVWCLFGCSAAEIPRDWPSWEQASGILPAAGVPGHEEPYHATFINAIGESARPVLKEGKESWDYPRGSIILKAGYMDPPQAGTARPPRKLYAMIKRPEDSRSRGGWVWVVREPAQGSETVMDAPFCVDCHSYANQGNPYGDRNPAGDFRDYLYVPYRAAGTGR